MTVQRAKGPSQPPPCPSGTMLKPLAETLSGAATVQRFIDLLA